jgi:predicted ATPase
MPSFSLVTGVNGSGKTHLLEAIELGRVMVEIDGTQIPPAEVARFDSATLHAGDTSAADPTQLMRARTAQWNVYLAGMTNSGWIGQLRQAATDEKLRQAEGSEEELYDWGLDLLDTPGQILPLRLASVLQQWPNYEQPIRAQFAGQTQLLAMLRHFRAETGLPDLGLRKLQFERLSHSAPLEVEPFKQRLSELFALYAKLRDKNMLLRAYGEVALTDVEFEDRNGIPPWNYLNDLLKAGSYDFAVTHPIPRDSDEPFTARLIHKLNEATIDFASLSSGERVLIGLAMCAYSAEQGGIKVNYPRVMLFDEIDAFLHPTMVQSLLDVVKNVLVEKQALHVIMTTHSPTTVALAEPNGVFKMSKGSPRLSPSNRSEAIASLTAGIPALVVNVENRRPVFVEDTSDASLFTRLVASLQPHVAGPFELIFLSTSIRLPEGSVGGGKKPVEDLVVQLRAAGMTAAYGLRDADQVGIESSHDGVILLGGARRHSIENYLLDPLLIAAFLNLHKFHEHVTPEAMGLPGTGFLGGLERLVPSEMQSAADAVLAVVGPPKGDIAGEDKTVQLCSGDEIKLPYWFVSERGHDWSDRLLEKIPQLKSLRGSHNLMLAMVSQVLDREPLLVANDLVATFNALRQ